METIRNYLESMFRGLPLTDKILKAKSELLQMMEDKYTELIRSGKSENEAVGEVIQNFGNLDDLAEDLGITDVLHKTKYSEVQRRKLSFEEVTEYLTKKKTAILFKALGIFMFIICTVFPILADAFNLKNYLGVALMFLSIGIGVVFVTLARSSMSDWRFLKTEPCSIDSVSIDYLKNKNREFTSTYSVLFSVGILLCILCFIPAVVFSEIGGRMLDELGGASLFLFVGAGVFLMVYAKSVKRTIVNLLKLNDQIEFTEKKETVIKNKTVNVIMSVYWTIVVCIYLCVSFLTFKWEITWIIWPIAAVANTIIKAIYSKDSE